MKLLKKFLLVSLLVFTVFMTAACGSNGSDAMKTFEKALNHLNDSTNLTINSIYNVTSTADGVESNIVIRSEYKEAEGRQYQVSSYDDICDEFYAETVDGEYNSYRKMTGGIGCFVLDNYYDYDYNRRAFTSLNITFELSDFTYDKENDKYVAVLSSINEKFNAHHNSEASEDELRSIEASFSKLNIVVEEEKFKSYEYIFTINIISEYSNISMTYSGTDNFEFGLTTVERPSDIYDPNEYLETIIADFYASKNITSINQSMSKLEVISNSEVLEESEMEYLIEYKEVDDKVVAIEDSSVIYGEKVNDSYVFYENDTEDGSYQLVSGLIYEQFRNKMLTCGIKIEASDFTYDYESGMFVGNFDTLNPKLVEHQVGDSTGQFDIAFVMFNIIVEDGQIVGIEYAYYIKHIIESATLTYRVITQQSFEYGTAVIERPEGIN